MGKPPLIFRGKKHSFLALLLVQVQQEETTTPALSRWLAQWLAQWLAMGFLNGLQWDPFMAFPLT